MKFKSILLLIFSALIAIIAIQNAQAIEVKFLLWKFSASQILVILGSFGLGLLGGILISMIRDGKNNSKDSD
ncbi:MAG: hypothetical protein CMO34_07180 [Verrucomicrobia bacterium]|nr:hypothetical protein [Verrucomicrobiota bacterium]